MWLVPDEMVTMAANMERKQVSAAQGSLSPIQGVPLRWSEQGMPSTVSGI